VNGKEQNPTNQSTSSDHQTLFKSVQNVPKAFVQFSIDQIRLVHNHRMRNMSDYIDHQIYKHPSGVSSREVQAFQFVELK
jgi:hypothetical protein